MAFLKGEGEGGGVRRVKVLGRGGARKKSEVKMKMQWAKMRNLECAKFFGGNVSKDATPFVNSAQT